jgi:hypothetical protein
MAEAPIEIAFGRLPEKVPGLLQDLLLQGAPLPLARGERPLTRFPPTSHGRPNPASGR